MCLITFLYFLLPKNTFRMRDKSVVKRTWCTSMGSNPQTHIKTICMYVHGHKINK